MTLVIRLPVRLGAEDWTVQQDVDRVVQTAAIVSINQIQDTRQNLLENHHMAGRTIRRQIGGN